MFSLFGFKVSAKENIYSGEANFGRILGGGKKQIPNRFLLRISSIGNFII